MSVWQLPSNVQACLYDVEQAARDAARAAGGGGDAGDADGASGKTAPGQREPLKSPLEFWAFKQTVTAEAGPDLDGATEEEETLLRNADRDLSDSVERLGALAGLCDSVVRNICKGKLLLDDLEAKHRTVSEKTSSLHEKCKKLLEEQTRFEKIVQDIETPLEFLRELDRIGPLLGLPLPSRLATADRSGTAEALKGRVSGSGDVRALHPDSPEFFGVLQRLDECVAYVEEHPEYKDYDEYSAKFQQLHLRGLSLVRNLIVDALRATASSARAGIEAKFEGARRASVGPTSRPDQSRGAAVDAEVNALLFIRFRALAKQLRGYMNELETRVQQKDAADLYYSCHTAYCGMRIDLLKSTVPRARELSLQGSLLQTLRVACPYLLTVCRNEFKLFHEFFNYDACSALKSGAGGGGLEGLELVPATVRGASLTRTQSGSTLGTLAADTTTARRDAFMDMMVDLCGALYDLVRPLVVKLADLRTLCEAVRTIEGDIIEGYAEILGESGRALHVVLVQILQDVQERLIYSTSQFIADNIAGFEPGASDLDYPKILQDLQDEAAAAQRQETQQQIVAADAGSATAAPRRSGILAGCYPSLDNTLQCMIWVYRCVEPQTFEELAQEAVVSCAASLQEAAKRIAVKSRIDSDLFFIKHLLMLREQISPFNTQLTIKQVSLDFSSTAAALGDFLAHTRNIFSRRNNAIVDLVAHGVPTIAESEIDCKRDLESQLKQACENFIIRTYEQALAALIAFLQRASKPLPSDAPAFHEQDFAHPDKVQAMLAQCQQSLPEFLTMIRSRMSLYLANAQTEAILANPIKANIFAALTQMTNCVEANYEQEMAAPMLRALGALRTTISQLDQAQRAQPQPRALEDAATSDAADPQD